MSGRSFTFSHAVLRRPAASIVRGLRALDTGTPDLAQFTKDHQDYAQALQDAGANLTILDPDEAFPDSVFVEDAALCLAEGAIILRPGAPSRLGEIKGIAPTLDRLYGSLEQIRGPGFVDGGDILVTETEILVGTSARTDAQGIAELTGIVAKWGYSLRVVQTPPGVLHFKTDCALLDAETILSTDRLAQSGCFDGYRVLRTPEGDEPAANLIRYNDLVVMSAGYPRTRDLLTDHGYDVREIGNTEAAKLDGGMSCLSLRFRLP